MRLRARWQPPRGHALLGVVVAAIQFGQVCASNSALANPPLFVEVSVPQAARAGFEELASSATGLHFTNRLAEHRHLTNQVYLNGAGVAAGDVDGDGWCDVYFCNLDGPNALFRNRGNFTFEDITARAGVACAGQDSTGAAFADVDGDGDLDLVVNSLGAGTRCFFNDGTGRFSTEGKNADLNARQGATSLALADVDGDGDLDLYLANYRTTTIRDQPNTRFSFRVVNGKPQVTAINGRPLTDPDLARRFNFQISLGEGSGSFGYEENGEPDLLLLNDGKGRFTPLSFVAGAFLDEAGQPLTEPPRDWGLSVIFRDLNADLAPDLYVCNDFRSPDRIWINDGRGRFQAMAPLAIRQTCLSAMGVDVADVDRDGWDDIFQVDMLSREHHYRLSQRIDIRPEIQPVGAIANRPQFSRNMLFRNRGDGTYAEIAQFSGLEAAEWSWMPVFLDVDLDGFEDILIPNGFERDNMNVDVLRELQLLKKQQKLTPVEQLRLRRRFPRLATPNLVFRNLRNLRFEETGAAWGFSATTISQGIALADFDNDGDLDLAVNNLNENAALYRNITSAPRVAVRLQGLPPNTRGIGARIRLLGGPVPQSQEMIAGGRYLSGDDPVRVFAGGAAQAGLTLEVDWRSGRRSTLTGVAANRIYTVREADALPPLVVYPPAPRPPSWFQDVSHRLQHRHHEEAFDDFALQPMLPKRLSQLGPGLAWFDIDGDGRDDLAIGSGRGGPLAVFRNAGQGNFERLPGPAAAARDHAGLVAWRVSSGPASILAGSANFEDGDTQAAAVQQFDLRDGTAAALLPGHPASTGPLALGDIDGDGDLDLFVGGRVLRGRYPQPASSRIYTFGAVGWTLDPDNSAVLEQAGLVSGAVFSDIDADGDPDLILACEWGPIRLFRNDQGRLKEATTAAGLDRYAGWWNGVATGDFDGDGRLDIVASNWGRNTKYEYYRRPALHAFHGDTDGNGTYEIIEAYLHPTLNQLAPLQPFHLVATAMPLIGAHVEKCDTYAQLSLQAIYGDRLRDLAQLEVSWLESTLFLNRGNHFEAQPLPDLAQLAPAFAVCVGDLDGDGHEDLFLSQNCFAVPPETSRYDAGRGLCLRGDGNGGFTPVPGQESGITVYGEQRGAALADFDEDGRVDLAVSQNGGETKLYRNVTAPPGLRIRLAGPGANPHAVGATVRVGRPGAWGAAREIQAGSGYWSQNSLVPVLSTAANPTHLQIRWPGGNITETRLPAEATEIRVEPDGRGSNTRLHVH